MAKIWCESCLGLTVVFIDVIQPKWKHSAEHVRMAIVLLALATLGRIDENQAAEAILDALTTIEHRGVWALR